MKSKEFWFFLFCCGTLLLNWPFLAIFGMALPVYLFVVWGVLIIIMGLIVNRDTARKDV